MEIQGFITNIERYSLHDGPGIRSTVFLKGCPLRCLWCCNPESQASFPQLSYIPEKCTACGRCIPVCPYQAIAGSQGDAPVAVDFSRCLHCGDCTQECYPRALLMIGKEMSAREVVEIVGRDLRFYQNSAGGITLSGGEPLFQPEFSSEILRLCRQIGIHTAMQTCGMAPWDSFRLVLPSLDLVIFDLKILDPQKHLQLTGFTNEQILANLKSLDESAAGIVIQIPLIPGINDSDENLDGMFRLAGRLKHLVGVNLLSYHNLGAGQYRRLGYTYPLESLPVPAAGYLLEKIQLAERYGLPITRFNG